MNNTIISTVTEHKHLGLQLSDDGNWNKHIDMIIKKAFSRVNILRERPFNLKGGGGGGGGGVWVFFLKKYSESQCC